MVNRVWPFTKVNGKMFRMKKIIFSVFLGITLFIFSVSPILADCVPFRGSAGPRKNVECFTDAFKATCDTNQECLNLINGTETPPQGSEVIPLGWTAPNTDPSSLSGSDSDVLCEGNGIKTAIGCIPVLGDASGKEFMTFVLRWAIGVGGGIAFLLILYAGFMTMTSAGNPERLKAGQELLTSAISGLILLILSVFVLNFIGINILGIFT